MSSPKRKQMKLSPKTDSKVLKKKRIGKDILTSIKRSKLNDTETIEVDSNHKDLAVLKRENFVKACEKVSCNSYFNLQRRIGLVYLPSCAKLGHEHENVFKEMSSYQQEAFWIPMKSNNWYEALRVCRQVCFTSNRYLSANVLKDMAEIMLNAHDDKLEEHSLDDIIRLCQSVYAQNFRIHPPCVDKKLRKCYLDFLTSPLDLKENTFTNRKKFKCENGLIKYCMNRLEHELSVESNDGPIINKNEHIPEEMKDSLKGMYWQKEAFEIHELLDRKERIDRLIKVLESVVELLQFDLAIWHYRNPSNTHGRLLRSGKPLMATILWSNNILCTGGVNAHCQQILRIFSYMVHLRYPQNLIDVMTTWLNVTAHTSYLCESKSNMDYPNMGLYSTCFAKHFYKIISVMPHSSVIRIIKAIKPSFMRYLIGNLHINKLLLIEETCVLTSLLKFFKEKKWMAFPVLNSEIDIPKIKYTSKGTRKLNSLFKICKKYENETYLKENIEISGDAYPKYSPTCLTEEISLNHIVETYYTTLESYFEAFNVRTVQDTVQLLNENLLNLTIDDKKDEEPTLRGSYFVSEEFIKKYRTIYQLIKEMFSIMKEVKSCDDIPSILKVFCNIDFFYL